METKKKPERTCVICKKKSEKDKMFRLSVNSDSTYSFDKDQRNQSRGCYICKEHQCLKRLSLHKKIRVSPEDLIQMLGYLKKEQKDYLNILKAMKNSTELVFGINMVTEEIKKINFMIIAEDIGEKPEKRLNELINEYNIKTVHFGTKEQLGRIFDKDEINVIAIKSKKVARGLMD